MAKSNRHVRRGGHFKAKGDQRSILIMRVGSPLDPDRSPRLGPTPSIPRHALAGVVTAHCYGAAGAVRSPVSSVPDPADCQIAFDFGAKEFVDLREGRLGGRRRALSGVRCHRRRHPDAVRRRTRAGGTLVTIVRPARRGPLRQRLS